LATRDNQEVWIDVSTIRDAGHVEQYLKKLDFDLVLHGHKHKAQLRETLIRDDAAFREGVRPLIVCGAGSVSCMELEHAEPNHYEVIEIQRLPRSPGVEFLQVDWRTLPIKAGAEWSTQKLWSVLG
jgi:hypothetical protein